MRSFITPAQSLAVLRILVSVIMMMHGAQRLYYGTVNGFGEYLNSQGFVVGVVLAWGITLFELAAGAALAFNYFTRPTTLIWGAQLIVGIILVHARNGWYVVGPSTGGVEYSLLLIVSLLVLFSNAKSWK